jgi:hypothetical protein
MCVSTSASVSVRMSESVCVSVCACVYVLHIYMCVHAHIYITPPTHPPTHINNCRLQIKPRPDQGCPGHSPYSASTVLSGMIYRVHVII